MQPQSSFIVRCVIISHYPNSEDFGFHCQPSLDTSDPKRPGASVLNSFVFLDTTQ